MYNNSPISSEMSYEAKALIKRRRRQKQVRLYYFIFLLAATVIIITASILLVSFSSQANDAVYQPSYKYFKSIQVEKGDTLWSIANEYRDCEHYESTTDYIKEVRKINSLTSDNIIAGSHIIIPYYSVDFID
jgi:hypothetical protein